MEGHKHGEDHDPHPINSFNWKNLIILDACRHDAYTKLRGDTDTRVTLGNNSEEFIKHNFSEGDWTDTIVVTANPHYHETKFESQTQRKPWETFHEVYEAYLTHWNENHNTVLPEDLAELAIQARKEHPDKRMIIHFMQPHEPFIDSKVQQTEDKTIWSQLQNGDLTREQVWNAHLDNLRKVLPYSEKLAEQLEGPTIITADHGEAMGEADHYGHPDGADIEATRLVPLDKRP